MIGLVGKKVGMTTVFGDDGRAEPVTILQAGPCEIVQIKTPERDGYSALQLGFDPTAKNRIKKPMAGHFEKAGTKMYKKLKEFRVDKLDGFEVGQSLTVSEFEVGEKVKVTGISKGKGFQGGLRRHGFKGGPKTHGQSDKWKGPGSIGQSSSPSRVFKGTKMAGRMGGEKVTRTGIEVIEVDSENNLILVKGPVAGPRSGYIIIRKG